MRELNLIDIRLIVSCNIPSGHTTEQYTRPKSKVVIRSPINTARFRARRAGINWIRAGCPREIEKQQCDGNDADYRQYFA